MLISITIRPKRVVFLLFFLAALTVFYSKNKKSIKMVFHHLMTYLPSNKLEPMNQSKLKKIPHADSQGIVLDSFILPIKDAYAPYNPAVILDNKQITIIYREDDLFSTFPIEFNSQLKQVIFDLKFNQIQRSSLLELCSEQPEDPRLILHNNQKILTFNSLINPSFSTARGMKVHTEDNKEVLLDPGLQHMEKNWMPFLYKNDLHYVYNIYPHKILKVNSQLASGIEFYDHGTEAYNPFKWDWGIPRGGCPPIELEDEYLTFFHSWYTQKTQIVYVMGAYTFDKYPPFAIRAISPYPILFKDLYKSRYINTADINKFVIFPSGAFISPNNSHLFLFCGENDSAIRVVEFDINQLLKSLIRPTKLKLK